MKTDKSGVDAPATPGAQVPGGCVRVAKGDLSGPLERRSVEKKSEHGLQAGSPHRCVLEGEDEKEKKAQTQEKFRSDDYYWSGKSASDDYEEEEEDDDVTLLLSANPIPCVTDDEAHYITTHEILLAELSDNEGDFDRGSSATWDVEDGSQVCSFVDYASFDSEGAARGALAQRTAVSTLRENDPSGSAKPDAAEESLSKAQQLFGGTSVGQIQLSIRTTSRAINGPGKFLEEGNILYRATRSGDVSRYVFRGVEGRGEPLRDGAQCFAVAPGRVHFGRQLRAKDVIEHSSGTSSAVSEPDDADKEVRTLTAKTFKSLAHPYFDAVNFGASSESSASERGVGLNRWSTFVDMRYGDMSQKLDKTFAAHQNSTTSFEMARNVGNGGHEGTMKVPGNKIFALNASGHNTTSSNKVELMGKFRQGQSGVITLTETLNFRCNVKSEGERRANGTVSRPPEDVTDALPRNLRRAAQPPTKAKEDASKKAIFASSLIKNVISKKMQFEQERKMERGEISEQHQATSPYWGHQESEGHRVRRQSSRVSESSSDCTVTNADDLGDIADGGPVEPGGDSRSLETTPFLPETQLESAYEAGIDAKKGTLDASKRTLLRSQNSAFRRWKDDEVEFQKDHKRDQTAVHMLPPASVQDEEGLRYAPYGGKLTKMSHLFVPSIQLSPSERGEQLLRAGNESVGGDGGKKELRSDGSLHVADSGNNIKSKSPEIKINLRSVKSNQMEPVAVSKLQTSNLGYDNAASAIRNKDFRCQTLAAALRGESADKVPHFTVRDIRDNKAKLQTPIHQVRDVRKLVKSSYHFVSLDNENRPADRPLDQKRQSVVKTPNSVSPIVIKCQSVNTNLGGKLSESLDNHRDLGDTDGTKSAPLHGTAGEVPVGDPFSTPEGDGDPASQSRLVPKWQEKIADSADKKSKMASQMALEKLQAAVRTMEQLYVFEKNEWKRKTESRPLTDSHVLSMIARQERGGPEDLAAPGVALLRGEDKHLKTSGSCEERVTANRMQAPISATGGKNMFSLSSSIKTSTNAPQQKAVTQLGAKSFAPMATKPPMSVKNSQLLLNTREGALPTQSEKPTQESSGASADHENYLTIPVKSHASRDRQVSSTEGASVFTSASQGRPTTPRALPPSPRGQEDISQLSGSSSTAVETRSPEIPLAAVYHSFPQTMPASQPQLFCFSPAITPTPALEPFQAMQRKVLLDPTTGNYYLVDSPLQPQTKRLYDPETGQYVDVPMPQPSPTPVPMSVSPLALSPGAYGHAYMVYPGFMPTPSVISAQVVQSQMPLHSELEAAKKSSSQKADSVYMDSPFYITTGKSSQPGSGAQQQATPNIPLQPIISITSQQGPRIIAPPSFDGTTMSFVVEHR